tara:strand:- start:1402 stop:2418 length:1017 start_codon:yes stop_codon:yes gene_type:complete
MIYIQSIAFILAYIFFIFFFKKTNFFNSEKFPHQNFTSKNFVLPIGGYLIIIFFILFGFENIDISFIYILIIFLIGALSDLKKFNSPKYRLIAQSLIIIVFIVYFDMKIISTRITFLDYFLKNYYLSIFFIAFCFLVLMNGTNFIDGLNGLVILYFLIIILILNLSGINFELNKNNFFIDNILPILIILLILNIFNKIYLGDSGSYLIGFLFSYYLISIYEQNQIISPFFIILLLWYPCFENLFSILRKQKFKKSAVEPDTKHFHQLLYFFFTKKFKNQNKILVNIFTSIVINIYNFTILYIGSKYFTKTNIQVLLILTSLTIYLFLYFILFKYRYKR